MQARMMMVIGGCAALGMSAGCGSDHSSAAPAEAGIGRDEDASSFQDASPDNDSRADGETGATGSDGREAGPSQSDAADSSPSIGDAGLFGIDPDTDIQTATDMQKGQLCDWRNEKLGGYGQSFPCGGGTILTDPSQAECVRSLFTGACVLPLRTFEACILALAPSHGCNPQYAVCAPVYDCYVSD
jgi:hypothetical protein